MNPTNTIEQLNEEVTLVAYPNPTDDAFYLEINEAEQRERLMSVYNLNGQLIYENTVFENTNIDVSNWAAGLYIIRVDNAFLKMTVL
jgi:hypothetical protein